METGLGRNQIIAELSRSPHGKLEEYLPLIGRAAKEDPEFLAHLIAWNNRKGQVRDAKSGVPVVSLREPGYADEFVENSLAHIAQLGPREMLAAVRFVLKAARLSGAKRMTRFRTVLGASLLQREKNWPKWERLMLQHRSVLKELLALLHVAPQDERTRACLHQKKRAGKTPDGKWEYTRLTYPAGGLFEAVSRLKNLPALEAAGVIMTRKIPFLVALGALGDKGKDPDLVMALIKSMTPTELVTNTNMLNELGMKTNAALRGAFNEALQKAATNTKNVLKTTTAVENIDDEETQEQLRGVQEKQLKNVGIDGDWLILADRSPSMQHAVELAKEVAGVMTAMVKGKVWLTFFDMGPQTIEVSGLTLDQIHKATQYINTNGSGTCIGCGLARMLELKQIVDGIAIVTDGGENGAPFFADAYRQYSAFAGKQVPVYMYQCRGDQDRFSPSMTSAGFAMDIFDLRGKETDYVSLPNLVQTMRSNRFSLIDEVLSTRLLQLPDALKNVAKVKAATSRSV